jgi:unsaturated rhamnogalacturonyl hydrolase
VEEIWADTIFMVVIFLARLGRLSGNKVYTQEAASQLLLHLQYLQDAKTGVLFHGYNCEHQNHYSEGRWTRGNGWIVLGTPMILSETDEIVTIPGEINERYQHLVDGVLSYQAQNGLWHTVMDQPDHYQETSGSAGIACGILKSIRQGLLSSAAYLPGVEKAVNGVLEKISPQGVVVGVSGGTPIMETIEGYNKLSQYPTLYGQGLVLMLLAEYMRFLGERHDAANRPKVQP